MATKLNREPFNKYSVNLPTLDGIGMNIEHAADRMEIVDGCLIFSNAFYGRSWHQVEAYAPGQWRAVHMVTED